MSLLDCHLVMAGAHSLRSVVGIHNDAPVDVGPLMHLHRSPQGVARATRRANHSLRVIGNQVNPSRQKYSASVFRKDMVLFRASRLDRRGERVVTDVSRAAMDSSAAHDERGERRTSEVVLSWSPDAGINPRA